MLKDIKKPEYLSHSQRSTVTGIPRVQYGLVVGLAILAILAGGSAQPALGLTMESQLQIRVPPTPAPVQVIPPSTSVAAMPSPAHQTEVKGGPLQALMQWTQTQSWLLPFAGGILIWAAGVVALLAVVALLFLRVRRRQPPAPAPPLTASIPFLKSSDGRLYFRLDRLGGNGLIIGRGKHGVDLRIDDTMPHADTVSNQHARVYYDTAYGHVIIEDLGSTNGIFINGRQAPRKNLLKDEWVVSLGSVALTYHDGESDTGPLD